MGDAGGVRQDVDSAEVRAAGPLEATRVPGQRSLRGSAAPPDLSGPLWTETLGASTGTKVVTLLRTLRTWVVKNLDQFFHVGSCG